MSGPENLTARDDFNVNIAASGRADLSTGNEDGSFSTRFVHAISVTQPVQSWTVIRDHVDFNTVGNVLSSIIGGLPPCPEAPAFNSRSSESEEEEIVRARNAAQIWLNNILLYPGARESPAVRQFLCYGAGIMPPQFQGVNWVHFTPSNAAASNEPQCRGDYKSANTGGEAAANHSVEDELEMDDMFDYGGVNDGDEGEDDYEDDAEFFSAAERYQPTVETVTQDDFMEFKNNVDDVEMIEDVGSLAQSMGLSHLGRSLQLQKEMSQMDRNEHKEEPQQQQQQGLNIKVTTTLSGSNGPKGGIGGIGNAVENAEPHVSGLSDSFFQKKPISAPRLDSFTLIKVVGKGSFGKVFLVREKQTSEMFALKVLRKDNIIRRNQVEHTRTERNVLGYVNHPFIVGLKMAFQSKDKLYFVLDYCAGGELFFHLSKVGKFPEPRAAFYAAEIVLAIAHVHELDIVYRDLKPENVLLDARGHVRLTDFGLSKEGINSSSSGATSFCGTPEYLAPEILNRQGHGRAVDWWSLGALLYEMLTGLPPFYCRDREKLFEKIRKGHLEYPRSLSARSQALLRGLLTKDPRRRLGSDTADADTIKKHTFFDEIDWEKLQKGEVPPPWNPQLHGSLDTSQFDEEFTNMPIMTPPSHQHGFGATPQDNIFEGFTFTDSRFYGPQAS